MKWINIVLAVLLLLCLAPMPYGYFQFVRLLATIVFAVMAFRYYRQRIMWLVYAFGTLTLLFQPFYKIALGRTIWNIVDVIVAIGLIALFIYEWRRAKGEPQYRIESPPVNPVYSLPEPEKIVFNKEGRLDWDVLMYVASEDNKELTDWFEKNPEVLEGWGKMIGCQVIYLPLLTKGLTDKEVIQYRAPYLKGDVLESTAIGNDYMLQFLDNPADRGKLKQGFIRTDCLRPGVNGEIKALNSFYPLESTGEKLTDQLHRIGKQINGEREDFLYRLQRSHSDDYENDREMACKQSPSILPQLGSMISEDRRSSTQSDRSIDAEYSFNSQLGRENTDDLLEEVRERIAKLRKRGIAESILEQLIHPDNRLSRMVITNDYRILLPDYNDMEIKMEPLVKAVYLLFLNHPEGIAFKHLHDYRNELKEIYQQLRPNGLNERALKSIEDVTDPCNNSINEKCARIRGAFVGEFDDYMARSYYIDGRRGEPKRISLPRELVEWE